MQIRDISHPLRPDIPVWPGHAAPTMALSHSHENGDGVQLTHFSVGVHTGTHLDAPRHFLAGGSLVDTIDLNVLMGPVRVVRYENESGPIPKAFFEGQDLPDPITRLLIHCDLHDGKLADRDTFFHDYAGLAPDAAAYLVARGLKLIGTDYLSIGPFYGDANRVVHETLLGASVVIVEGLDLRNVPAGTYTLVCLPINAATDGSPCRAVLLPEGALPETLTDDTPT